MTDKIPDNAEMVNVVRPARIRHVLKIAICAPLVGVLIWVEQDVFAETNLVSLIGVMSFWMLMVVFPLMRSVHALILRPHFRTNGQEVDVRHWGSSWSILVPFHMPRRDQFQWSEICGIKQQRTSIYFLPIEDYIILKRTDKKPIHIHRGVFHPSTNAIANIIQNKLSMCEMQGFVSSNDSNSYSKRLEREFAVALSLSYSSSSIRLAGLILGPVLTCIPWPWVADYSRTQNEDNVVIMLLLFGFFISIVGIIWFIFAIDEAVRSWRFRNKKFWLRADGFSAGANEFSARVYGWNEIAGARRRVTQMVNQADRPTGYKLDGLDILLHSGETIWIPESFSKKLDELCEVLSPDDGTIHVDPLDD